MKNQKGFSLIELMIVVAIIGIIAAIAIPALLRARIAANEGGAKSDLKATTSSTVTYANGNNGAYPSDLSCMGAPTTCSGGVWPPGTTPFLDPLTGCAVIGTPPAVLTANSYEKSGYTRIYVPGTLNTVGTPDTGLVNWTMQANPMVPTQSGTNYYGTDSSGLTCFDNAGPIVGVGGSLPAGCSPIN